VSLNDLSICNETLKATVYVIFHSMGYLFTPGYDVANMCERSLYSGATVILAFCMYICISN
jgi:hypothetical protein